MTQEKFGGIEKFFRRFLQKDQSDFVKICQEKFKKLNESEIRLITGLVNKEVTRSAGFGLEINPEIVEKEKIFYLQLTDSLGGVKAVTSYEFSNVMSLLDETTVEVFSQERKYYWDHFSAAGDSTKNQYDCHLHYLNGSFLNGLHNELVR